MERVDGCTLKIPGADILEVTRIWCLALNASAGEDYVKGAGALIEYLNCNWQVYIGEDLWRYL
jgi:hypothetical protein